MRRKIRALRSLFELAPTCRVILADGRVEGAVSLALSGAGTTIADAKDAKDAKDAEDAEDAKGAEVPAAAGGVGGAADVGPGPSEWLGRLARHELDVYGKRGVTLVAGEGARVRDDRGRVYIDCIGGHGALALGHRHPALVRALREQADRIWFVPGAFATPVRARYLERLHGVLPEALDRTFLSNSGAESVEAALKIARAHTGRTGLAAATGGFHGRTFGALSVTHEAYYREPFAPLLTDVRHVPFNDPDALRTTLDGGVAALVLEPVQGEGGVHVADPGFLREARRVCDETGTLLVFDEVQTGFGRTGRMFAFEHSGVVPDVLCLAKSIAGGLPLGATVVREGIILPPGTHGSTFGGNPVVVAVAEATLATLLDTSAGDLVADAETKGRRLADRVRAGASPLVREIRQTGLMIGIQLKRRVRDYLGPLQERGVLALAAGSTVLRLLPPLVISAADVDAVADAILDVLGGA